MSINKDSQKTPNLRFKDFTDDWEQRKLGFFLRESRIIGTNGAQAKKLTVKLWGKGVIPKSEIYQGSKATQYYVRSSGQFIYGKLDFLNQAFGIIPDNLNGYESTLDSPAFDISKNLNKIFLLEYVSRESFYRYQGLIANGSRKAKRIHVDTFLNMPIKSPTIIEQEQIGNFIKLIDNTITLHQRKLDQLNQLKEVLLQQMFPGNGETVPKLRFAGFEGDWEERKLGDLLHERNQKSVQTEEYPLVSFTVENGVTEKTERYNRNQLVSGDSDAKVYKVTKLNDIVYNPANLKFGAIDRNKYGKAVFSPIYVTFEVIEDYIFAEFIEFIVTSQTFIGRALKYQQGTVYERQSVGVDDFLNLTIRIPNLDEQKLIGLFLNDLNKKLLLQKDKLDQLKNMKQVLLQNMFI